MIDLTSSGRNHFVYYISQLAEGGDFQTFVMRGYFLFNDGYKVFGQKQRVATTCTRVLHCGTIAMSHLAIFEQKENRYGFASLANAGKAWCNRLARIEVAIVACSSFDGALIVKEKTCFPC